jgi:hypothetical protein
MDVLLGVIVLAMIPAAVHGGYRWFLSSDLAGAYREIDLGHRVLVLGAIMMGAGIVLSDPAIRENLGPGRLVAADGFWALGWSDFLLERAEPLGHLWGFLTRDVPVGGITAVLIALALALLGTAVVIIVVSDEEGAMRATAWVPPLVVIILMFQTIYLTMLAAYLVYIMNFWSLILWIIIVQYFRNQKL